MPGELVRDPQLPAVERLLSPGAADVLTAAVEGGTVREASLRFVDYYPGHSVCASYDAVVEREDRVGPELLAVFARGDGEPEVWRYPHDPYLPGLVDALDAGYVQGLLEEAGLGRREIGLEVRSYSPRGRAAIEVTSEAASQKLVFRPGAGFVKPGRESVAYLKILPPPTARTTYAAHAALAGVVPVPACVSADLDRGVLAITALPGVPLWDCITRGKPRALDADELLDVLRRIEGVDLEHDSRMAPTRTCRHNMATLAAVLPDQRGALERFGERLGDDAPLPAITIHGDFHEVQVLVDERGLSGLLDLDDAGRGHRVDDMAMLLGRLWAYSQSQPATAERVSSYFWSLLEAWERHVDPVELRRRTAAVTMNNAVQAFRYQERGWPAECARGIAWADALMTRLLPG